VLRESLLDAAAVLLPVRCAGCGEPDRGLCSSCRRQLAPDIVPRSVDGVPVWSALEYSGVPRRVILAYKESGRVDAAPALARALRVAIAEGQRADRTRSVRRADALLPVLIPSTAAARRARGFHPTGMILARARLLVPPLWRGLRLTRQTQDQAGLTSSGRAANRRGSMVASTRLRGRRCLIVDDIVTSGSTIAEAARAIASVGGHVVGAATVAATPRRADTASTGSARTAPSKSLGRGSSVPRDGALR
jgi:predicted amidophosphoribosyltransferase